MQCRGACVVALQHVTLARACVVFLCVRCSFALRLHCNASRLRVVLRASLRCTSLSARALCVALQRVRRCVLRACKLITRCVCLFLFRRR